MTIIGLLLSATLWSKKRKAPIHSESLKLLVIIVDMALLPDPARSCSHSIRCSLPASFTQAVITWLKVGASVAVDFAFEVLQR
jgi:hypothetical protein